jgi:hypothetical protein
MMPFMTRIARVVAPGLPHHVTQRGNRGERIFFEAEDFRLYKDYGDTTVFTFYDDACRANTVTRPSLPFCAAVP